MALREPLKKEAALPSPPPAETPKAAPATEPPKPEPPKEETKPEPPKSDPLLQPLKLEEGYLVVPEGPGLGIALSTEAIGKYPPVDKVLETPLGYDGSVQDR